jgi:hypothetical protein
MRRRANQVFNSTPRRILRKHISTGEVVVGAMLVLVTGGMGWWIAAQEDRFDPGERDISIDVLRAQSVADTLYKTPLKVWVDPATPRGAGAAPTFGLSAAPRVRTGSR